MKQPPIGLNMVTRQKPAVGHSIWVKPPHGLTAPGFFSKMMPRSKNATKRTFSPIPDRLDTLEIAMTQIHTPIKQILVAALSLLLLTMTGSARADAQTTYPTFVHSGNGVLHNNYNECWGTGPNDVTAYPEKECLPAAPAPASKAAPAAEHRVTTVTLAAEVLFDFDKSVLKASGKKAIDEVLAQIGQGKLKSIRVDGHTDWVGTDAYNQKLSVRRAVAVKDYLMSKGLAETIQAVGHGKREPVADNHTVAGRAKNRRAEITFEE
jgi:OOP family OmpA-OmpF porin